MWYMSENEKWDRDTSREVEIEWSTGETMNISDGELYYKATTSS